MTDINNFSNKAILVHIDKYPIDVSNSKEEFQDLVRSANINILDTTLQVKAQDLKKEISYLSIFMKMKMF